MEIKFYDIDTGDLIPQLSEEEMLIFKSLDTSMFDWTLESVDYRKYKYQFEKTKDGLYAVSAFQLCSRCSLNIPKWIIAWLSDGFTSYTSSQFDESILSDLGKSLGVSTQRDKRDPKHIFKSTGIVDANLRQRQRTNMRLLISQFEFTIKVAAELVWNKDKVLETKPLKPSSYEQLAKQFTEWKWAENNQNKFYFATEGLLKILKKYDTPGLSNSAAEALSSAREKLSRSASS